MTTFQDNNDSVPRFYVRCIDCLSIGVVEHVVPRNCHCNLCGGLIETMGKVVQQKLEVEKERSACDKRCTHAVGPICVCKCGCANHGTGRVVLVTTVQDLPVIAFDQDAHALDYALGYRHLAEQLQALVGNWRTAARDYANPKRHSYYSSAYAGYKLVQKAVEARTLKARFKHLNAVYALKEQYGL